MRNAAHKLPCGHDSIYCCNVLRLFPVLAHFECDLWREQSCMSSEVRFSMLIQFLVLICVLSTHLCPDQSYYFTIKMQIWLWCFMNRVWAKLNNTVHCTWSAVCTQLCSWLPFWQRQPLLLKFLKNSKPMKFQSKNNGKISLSEDGAHTEAIKHLCLICLCKKTGNTVAHLILIVSKFVRKQGPLKIKN